MSSSELRAKARDSLTGNYWVAVLTAFVAAIFGSLLANSNVDINIDLSAFEGMGLADQLNTIWDGGMVLLALYGVITGVVTSGLSIAQLVLGGVVQLGYTKYLLKQHDRQECGVKDLFSQFDHFAQGFLQFLLRHLFIFLWSLLFVIPGIVKSFSYAMTPFIMAENPGMKARDAITASKELMDGHKADLFWLELTFIGWDLLNLLTLGIGSIFLNPYKNAAIAAFYRDITPKKEEPVNLPEPEVTETTYL